MNKSMKLLVFFLATILLFAQSFALVAIASVNVTAQSAIVMNADTGEVYYEKNADEALVPASMTKVMVMYIVYEELAKGTIKKDTIVPISQYVANMSRNPKIAAVVPLDTNQTYTVEELINAILIPSAGASPVAMAELISGSEEAFVTRMNETAKELGLTATYYECHGNGNNQITPRSMAILVQKFIQKYPDVLNYTSKSGFNLHGKWYNSTNRLLKDYYFEGADGFKTGTTAASGYCFTATASREGNRVISVVMKSSSTTQRFVDSQRLMEYSFEQIEQQNEMADILSNIQISFSDLPDEISKFTPLTIKATLQNVPQDYQCKAQWYINGQPIQQYSNERFVIKNGKTSELVFLPADYDSQENILVGLSLSLPNGKMIKQEKEIKISQKTLKLSGYMNISSLTIYPNTNVTLPVTVKAGSNQKYIVPVEWRIDGKTIKGFSNNSFVVKDSAISSYFYKVPKDTPAGNHEITFIINPNFKGGLEQKTFTTSIQILQD